MRITINSDNNWYEVIWYVQNKTIYYHIYPSTYKVWVQMILHKHVSVYIRYDNEELIYLQYMSYYLRHIHYIRSDTVNGCE